MKKILKMSFWLLLAIAVFSLFKQINFRSEQNYQISYSDFIESVRTGMINKVDIQHDQISGKRRNGEPFVTYNPNDAKLIDELLEYEVEIDVNKPEPPSFLMQILMSWGPILLLIAVWIYFMRKQQNAMSGQQGQFGKSKAKLIVENQIKIKFHDVAGVEEAKQDVVEVVDFLKAPEKYQQLGGQIPRGILMVGPPGTGKTLLAKAIAGEAGVPFFSLSGSDFVEMFVGVGASRVRDLFKQAKEQAPCIIFIDEIDAVGRHRSSSAGHGGNDEREQTLNQLLVEMDGFSGNESIIVIAATNRMDVLDKALLRPGRFDRQITLGLPDIKGREQILNVHINNVPEADDVNLHDLARGTPGFSGAELANLINEAALFAARGNKKLIHMEDLDKARDKIIMGVEKKSMIMRAEDKLMTAYHEAGHAIVGTFLAEHDPVYKVSIMPRGGALGITMFLPEQDTHSASKDKLESQIASLFGGRVAEELIYGKNKITTGASNDIERATQFARDMVTKWGLSERLGPLDYGDKNQQPYFGGQSSSMSEKTAQQIDEEIRRIIDDNYQKAKQILIDHEQILHNMANALMQWETIDKFQIEQLMAGQKLAPPPPLPPLEEKENKAQPENTNPEIENQALDTPGLAN